MMAVKYLYLHVGVLIIFLFQQINFPLDMIMIEQLNVSINPIDMSCSKSY